MVKTPRTRDSSGSVAARGTAGGAGDPTGEGDGSSDTPGPVAIRKARVHREDVAGLAGMA